MTDILFNEETVEFVRETLLACQVYLHAQAQAESILKGFPETRKSSLLKNVEECMGEVEAQVKDYVLDQYDRQREAMDEPLADPYATEEELDALDA